MSIKVGRNDPCPCGSGKKYKRCHLPLDQQRKPEAEAMPMVKESEEPPAAMPAKVSPAYMRELVEKVPKNKRAEFNDLLEQTLEMAEYLECQEEVQAAGNALESHRAEFERLLADEQAYLAQVRTLFGQEQFASMRFTPQDVRRAFEHLGGPPNLSLREQAAKKLHAAIVFLSDEKRRPALAMKLLKHLPRYVKEGRFMDAWVIQQCAFATKEYNKESNAFLYEMFAHGYDAWNAEKEAPNEELLRELGLDRAQLQSMSLDEIHARLEQMVADPAKKESVEKFFQSHPEESQKATANIEEMEREYLTMLGREDARSLLLPSEEVEPWATRLFESWQKATEQKPELAEVEPGGQESKDAFYDVIHPILQEMARTLFTAERTAQLTVQLGNYQRELFAAGDKRTAVCAMTALNFLKKESAPEKNYIIVGLCYASFRAFVATLSKQNAGQS